jgi:hypothetical protein
MQLNSVEDKSDIKGTCNGCCVNGLECSIHWSQYLHNPNSICYLRSRELEQEEREIEQLIERQRPIMMAMQAAELEERKREGKRTAEERRRQRIIAANRRKQAETLEEKALKAITINTWKKNWKFERDLRRRIR